MTSEADRGKETQPAVAEVAPPAAAREASAGTTAALTAPAPIESSIHSTLSAVGVCSSTIADAGAICEPDTQASKPEVKASEPDTQASKPEVQASEPDTQTCKPEVQASEPDTQTNELDVQDSLARVPILIVKNLAERQIVAPTAPAWFESDSSRNDNYRAAEEVVGSYRSSDNLTSSTTESSTREEDADAAAAVKQSGAYAPILHSTVAITITATDNIPEGNISATSAANTPMLCSHLPPIVPSISLVQSKCPASMGKRLFSSLDSLANL